MFSCSRQSEWIQRMLPDTSPVNTPGVCLEWGGCINKDSSLFHRAMWRSYPRGLWFSCPFSWHYPNVLWISTLARSNPSLVKQTPSILCDLCLGRYQPAKLIGRRQWNDDTAGVYLQTVRSLSLSERRRRLWAKGDLVVIPLLFPLSVTNRYLQIGIRC